MPNSNSALLAQLMLKLHEFSQNLQPFLALRDQVTPINSPNPYCMMIHSDPRSTTQHARWYDGFRPFTIAAIIPEAEYGIVGRMDIVICWRGELSATGSERFDNIPVTRRSYDPLRRFLLLPHGSEGMTARFLTSICSSHQASESQYATAFVIRFPPFSAF